MATTDAKLRLVISAQDQTGNIFSSIAAKARETGNNISAAVSAGRAGTGELVSSLENLNSTVDQTTEKVGVMDKIMALQGLGQLSGMAKDAGASLLGFLSDGVDQAKAFEVSTVDLRAALAINAGVYNQSGKEALATNAQLDATMAQLSSKAQTLGADYMFNGNQAQEMFYSLASSGVPAKAILDGVGESTMQLAQATRTELIPTTNILASTYHQFGDSLKQAYGDDTNKAFTHVADTLTNVRLVTHESLADIAQSLKYVAPAVDGTKIGFADLGTSMALLARNGISSSMAGTALRRMFTNLTPQSKQAKQAMEDLGIITADGSNRFFDASGNMKSMTEIMDILHTSTAGLGDSQKSAALKTIFGQYALQSMAVMAKTSGKDFDDLKSKVTQSGTASDISGKQMETLAGKLDVVGENWTDIKKKIGQALEDSLKPLADVLIDLSKKVLEFTSKHPEITQFLAKFAAIAGIVLVVAGSIGGFLATIGMFSAAWGVAMGAIGLAEVSFLAIVGWVALVVAIVAVLYLAWKNNFGGIRDATIQLWGYIKPVIIDAAIAIKDSVVSAVRAVMEWWKKIAPDVEHAVANIIRFIKYLSPIWKAVWEGVQAVVKVVWNAIKGIIEGAWDVIRGIFQFFVHLFTGEWGKMWEDVKTIFSGVWKIIVSVFTGVWDSIKAILSAAWKAVSGMFVKLWEDIKAPFAHFVVWLEFQWLLLKMKVADVVISLVLWLIERFQNAWENISAPFRKFATWITDKWNEIKTAIVDKAKEMADGLVDKFNAVKTFFTELPDKMKQWGLNAVKMFADGIGAGVKWVEEQSGAVVNKMMKLLGFASPTKEGPGSKADKWAPNFMKMFAKGIEDHRNLVEQAATGVAMDLHSTVGVQHGALPVAGAPRQGGQAPVFNITINSNAKNGNDLANEFVDAVRRYVPVVTY